MPARTAVTVITKTQDKSSGFTGFTDTEIIRTRMDRQYPAARAPAARLPASRRRGRKQRVADGAALSGPLADQHPASLDSLSAPRAAFFGQQALISAPHWNQPGQADAYPASAR